MSARATRDRDAIDTGEPGTAGAARVDPEGPLEMGGEAVNEGLRKAAIFLVSLDPDVAADVLKQLSEEEARLLSKEILDLGLVNKTQVSRVVSEFHRTLSASDVVKMGGTEQAFSLLKRSFPTEVANQIIRGISRDRQDPPFDFLKGLAPDVLLPFLQNEHPQTIAVVLSYLDPKKAAELLGRFSQEHQSDIVRRIGTLDHTSPEAIRQLEMGLRRYLSTVAVEELEEVGGVKACAEILNALDKTVQGDILDDLEQENADLAESIKKLMFVFEDIIHVDDRGIQAVLKEVENKTLALALKGSSESLKDKILGNMSQRAGEAIREEMSFLGPVRVTDVQAAQQSIVDIVRRLEEAGEVTVAGRGAEGAMIE